MLSSCLHYFPFRFLRCLQRILRSWTYLHSVTSSEFACKVWATVFVLTRTEEWINDAEAEQRAFSIACHSLKAYREGHYVIIQTRHLLPTHNLTKLLMQPSLSQALEKWLLVYEHHYFFYDFQLPLSHHSLINRVITAVGLCCQGGTSLDNLATPGWLHI